MESLSVKHNHDWYQNVQPGTCYKHAVFGTAGEHTYPPMDEVIQYMATQLEHEVQLNCSGAKPMVQCTVIKISKC